MSINSFSKIEGLVSWAWTYPVPWIWIGMGVTGLVGLISVIGLVIGLRMKWEDHKNAKRP